MPLASITAPRINLRLALKIAILLVFVTGQLLNWNAGWADNGDFMRIARWFTTGPVGNETWPTLYSDAWYQRFYTYYVPDWKLDTSTRPQMFNSAVLLWAPGVLLNRVLYSPTTLHLPLLSHGARAALFVLLLLVFAWIDRRSTRPLLHYLTIALPLALLFSTTDIAAFYNSFYQENGSIVFTPFLAALILAGRWSLRGWKYYLLYFAAVTLVAASKTASFYWPALALPFVITPAQIHRRPALMSALALTLLLVPTLLGLKLTEVPGSRESRPYIALFTGTLMFSENPQQHLARLGLSDMAPCLGKDYFSTQEGRDCAQQHPEKVNFGSILQTLIREPKILLKQLDLLVDRMQNYSLRLGKYAIGDDTLRFENRLNFWSYLKAHTFPKGWLLLALTPLILALTWTARNRPAITADLALCALLFLGAFWIDSLVEIWGDGQRDLLKHLVMPNMFFDYLWIAALNLALLLTLDRASAITQSTEKPFNHE